MAKVKMPALSKTALRTLYVIVLDRYATPEDAFNDGLVYTTPRKAEKDLKRIIADESRFMEVSDRGAAAIVEVRFDLESDIVYFNGEEN